MPDPIACLTIWLGEPLRCTMRTAYRRACNWISPTPPPQLGPVIPEPPAYTRDQRPDHALGLGEPLDGHEIRLVRPYLVAHEQAHTERMQRLQRECRTAAALTLGLPA